MKVKKIQLKGYKRFHDLTIDLGNDPKRIVALVGANGCGKSSVFDGMLWLLSARGGMLGNTPRKNYQYHSLKKDPGFSIRNVLIECDKGNFLDVQRQKASQGKENTVFSFRSSYRYNSNLKITNSLAVSGIRLNNYGASNASDLDDKVIENYRRLYMAYHRYLNKMDCKPSEAKEKIIGDINSAIQNCLNLKMTSIGDIESGRGTLYFSKPDHPVEFDFNVLSAGEKEVVDILLDLYLRREEYSDTVFLIDEPELHINTSIQKKLLIEINKMVGTECQIWIATHSIGFLRALKEDIGDDCQIVHFPDGTEWASTAQALSPMVKTRSKWMEIFKTALDDLANLISPQRIIYCEGKSQPGKDGNEDGLDAKVFNNIFSSEFNETIFVSSGGNTELDQRSEIAFKILGKVFNELEIWVLKDRDMSSGKPNNEKDRLEYLANNHPNHRVLKRWELENYLFDKAVLQKYCVANNRDFQESRYDEFVTDVHNQNVKNHIGRIRSFCGITTSIDPEVFKLNLSEYITADMDIYAELKQCIFDRK